MGAGEQSPKRERGVNQREVERGVGKQSRPVADALGSDRANALPYGRGSDRGTRCSRLGH